MQSLKKKKQRILFKIKTVSYLICFTRNWVRKRKNPSVSLRNTVFSLLGALGHKDIMPSYRWPGFWNHKTLRAGASHTFHVSGRVTPQGTSVGPHRALSQVPRLVHLGTPPPCGGTEVNPSVNMPLCPTLNTAGDAWRWLLTLIVIRAVPLWRCRGRWEKVYKTT